MMVSLKLINACAIQLFTTIAVNDPAPGLKAIFSFKVPDQRSGKVRYSIISHDKLSKSKENAVGI